MGTPVQDIYDSFLSKMTDDEWSLWTLEEAREDWHSLMMAAIPRFKFPKQSLEISGDNFVNNLSNFEIQIISQYMKVEWLNRSILTWENIKPLYVEKDFSPANLLDKMTQLLQVEKKDAMELESIYYRSEDGKPYKYSKLAGV